MSDMFGPSTSSLPAGIDALYQVRLLSALRSGDPAAIHPFLADFGRDKREPSESKVDLGSAALHLAIRCASCDVVGLLLAQRSISPNAIHPPGSGNTALHVAASLARADVVNLLLEQEGIDDAIRDNQGKTCLEVAKGKDCIHAIKDSRSFLTASYRSLLRTYVHSPAADRPPQGLVGLLSSPRIRHVDLSYLDDESGTTLLHEAARRKDLKTVELAIRAGADVFVRDRRGRMVYECVGKDDRMRAFLRQFTNQDTSLIETPSNEPPDLKGYLNKYTNVARGYNTRWFVLEKGVLSYYRHQEDENVASRGSIAMKTAVLKTTPGGGGLRFEVHSTPSRGHSNIQKWYMKANHPVEASRWIQALTKAIEWYRREADRVRPSVDTDAASMKPPSTRTSILGSHSRANRDGNGFESATSSTAGEDSMNGSPMVKEGDMMMDITPDEQDRDPSRKDERSSMAESERHPPHSGSFGLHGNSTIAHLELATQMLHKLQVGRDASGSADLKKAVDESFNIVHGMLTEYVQMVGEREEWWKEKLERERERQSIWEESLQAVVKEGEVLEKELRSQTRRKSRMMDSSLSVSEMGTLRRRPSQLALPSPPLQEDAVPPLASSPSVATLVRPPIVSPVGSLNTLVTPRPFSLIMSAPLSGAPDGESLVDTDDEDEFFDAIESGTLPNLVVTESLTGRPPAELPVVVNKEQYKGYENLRKQLSITSDDRPPMSLWAVLKNSIGKDLTKISFPVFFNEPTSMLQRMAEDMEFSECLDAAVAESDPHRRIAFVAAFAMSNYSSTIGRIAKPFNPMLSETFEYIRFDKQYRYVSEQVSHHPPISACWAEAPLWHYYGEVDAQNKFMGKSFEIRPTGVAHADLILPEELAPTYPKATGAGRVGKVVEHYSWKKVTTNISGFILGSPTIDHYGDMTVVNHRTGDKCILTFKPRGWRGRDAFEISGYVMDAHDNITYEIAGRWNSQLVARAVGTGLGHLHPDVSLSGPNSPTTSQEYILLWRNSDKPPAPFNLTPFAITLNDCPEDTLRPYLCPTDCRLRPDQRAFELGKYERANDLKNKQEEFQRATRRAREEGQQTSHRPRWFTAETEPDTGERVWSPSRVGDRIEYWAERERIWQAKKKAAGEPVSWKDVDRIFIEDEP